MLPQILTIITTVMPEVMAFIKGFHAAAGNMPTDAQVIAGLNIDADRITAISDAWLASHPATPTLVSSTTVPNA